MEPIKKKVKTLEKLSAEKVLDGINPYYHGILISTLFEEKGTRETIQKSIDTCRVTLWRILNIPMIRLGDASYDEYPEIPYQYELSTFGSHLFVGNEASTIGKDLINVYQLLGNISPFFKK